MEESSKEDRNTAVKSGIWLFSLSELKESTEGADFKKEGLEGVSKKRKTDV